MGGVGRGEQEVLRLLVAAVVEAAEELGTNLYRAAARSPSYRHLPEKDLRRSLQFVTTRYLEALMGDELGPKEAHQLQDLFADRLRRGTPVDEVVNAVEAAGEAGYLFVQRIARDLPLTTDREHEIVARAGLRVVALTGRLVELVGSAEQELDASARGGSAFVQHAVEGLIDQESLLRQEAERLGLPPHGRHWGLLCVVPRRGHDLVSANTTAEAIATAVGTGPLTMTRRQPMAHVVALLVVEDEQRWCSTVLKAHAQAGRDGSAVAHVPALRELAELRRTYKQMTPMLRYLSVLPRSDNMMVLRFYRDTEARPADERMDIFRRDLGPLVTNDPELLQVLDAIWIADGYQTTAAGVLGLSKSSMALRRTRVKDATNLDWEQRHHWLVLSQAIVCRWLAAAFEPDYDPEVWGPAPDLSALCAAAAALRLPEPRRRARRTNGPQSS